MSQFKWQDEIKHITEHYYSPSNDGWKWPSFRSLRTSLANDKRKKIETTTTATATSRNKKEKTTHHHRQQQQQRRLGQKCKQAIVIIIRWLRTIHLTIKQNI